MQKLERKSEKAHDRLDAASEKLPTHKVLTVSYTHLDVYKRQSYSPCSSGTRCVPIAHAISTLKFSRKSKNRRHCSLNNSTAKAKPKMTVKNGVFYGDALSAQEKKRIVMQKRCV